LLRCNSRSWNWLLLLFCYSENRQVEVGQACARARRLVHLCSKARAKIKSNLLVNFSSLKYEVWSMKSKPDPSPKKSVPTRARKNPARPTSTGKRWKNGRLKWAEPNEIKTEASKLVPKTKKKSGGPTNKGRVSGGTSVTRFGEISPFWGKNMLQLILNWQKLDRFWWLNDKLLQLIFRGTRFWVIL
jgi:hypothetical protein